LSQNTKINYFRKGILTHHKSPGVAEVVEFVSRVHRGGCPRGQRSEDAAHGLRTGTRVQDGFVVGRVDRVRARVQRRARRRRTVALFAVGSRTTPAAETEIRRD